MEEENDKLYMPSNISAEVEILKGITKKELKYLAYLMGISAVISSIIGLIFSNFQILILSFIFFTIISYFSVAKTSYETFSFVKNIMLLFKFHKEQNLYKYKYKDFWRDSYEDTKQK